MGNTTFPASQCKGLAWDVKKTPIFNNIIQVPASLKNETRIQTTSAPQHKFEVSYEFLRQDVARSLAERDTVEGFFKARGGNFDSFLLKLSDLTQDSADSAVTGAPAGTADGTTTAFTLQRTVGGFTDTVDAVSSTGFNLYVGGVLVNAAQYTLNANGTPATVSFPLTATATITQIAVNGSNITTVTCNNTFYVGQQVVCTGVTTPSSINSVVLTILTASPTQFTASGYTHVSYGPSAAVGTVTPLAPPTGAAITYDAATFYYRVRFVEASYDFNLWAYRFWDLQSLTFLQVSS